MKFSNGGFCIIPGGPSLSEEWYLKISQIVLVGASMNKYLLFLMARIISPSSTMVEW